MNKKTLRSWMKERKLVLLIPILFSAIFIIIFWIYSYDYSALLYTVIISNFCAVLLLIMDYVRYYRAFQRIENIGSTRPFILPESDDSHQLAYQEVIRELEKQIGMVTTNYTEAIRKSNDYYTLWTHQIKTPIMAANLLSQQQDVDVEILKMELFKIEQYVDMALGYQRLQSIESDFSFEECAVDSLVKEAVKNLTTVFIYQRVTLDIRPLSSTFITDKKWFVFVLEQVLSNALKYSPAGEITMYMSQGNLVVEDNGIGIKKEYLPRIFERGFTGNSGRDYRHSTGIGLYLCRETLQKLSLAIWVESEYKVGTKVFISLNPKAL